ncbi:MAG: sensor histidine kinase [Myxococcota bacterium]
MSAILPAEPRIVPSPPVVPAARVAAGLLAIVVLEAFDYVTGPSVSFALLFLLPVVWLAWNAGAAVGVGAALVAVGCELLVDLAWPQVHGTAVYLWNAFSRAGVLVFAALATARIRRDARSLARVNARLDHALASEQAAHERSEHRFGLVADALADYAIVLFDAAGRAVRWSAATPRITGHGEDEIAGRRLDELFPAAGERPREEATLEVRREVERWTARQDGDRYFASMLVYTIGEGASRQALAVVRDATLRETSAAAVRRARDEAVAATRELEDFSYTVGHDLRAPLRAVDGLGAILEEDAADRLGEIDLAHVRRMRAAARRMGRLVDDLLAMSRLGRAPVRRARVDLSAIARDIAGELRAGSPGREVDLVVAEGLEADADPGLVTVLLRHLLDNAWKFTAGRQRARIEVGEVRSPERAFYVRDDGVGFDARFVDRLFRPFERLHGEEFVGTGIGLATVRRIVERHGGRVWAEGALGAGATVYFTLPPDREVRPGLV